MCVMASCCDRYFHFDSRYSFVLVSKTKALQKNPLICLSHTSKTLLQRLCKMAGSWIPHGPSTRGSLQFSLVLIGFLTHARAN